MKNRAFKRSQVPTLEDVADVFDRSLDHARGRRGYLERNVFSKVRGKRRRDTILWGAVGLVTLTGVAFFILRRGGVGKEGLSEYLQGKVAA